MKEMNDRRAAEEERKQIEMEARQKLEKQLAKERALGPIASHGHRCRRNSTSNSWSCSTRGLGAIAGRCACQAARREEAEGGARTAAERGREEAGGGAGEGRQA